MKIYNHSNLKQPVLYIVPLLLLMLSMIPISGTMAQDTEPTSWLPAYNSIIIDSDGAPAQLKRSHWPDDVRVAAEPGMPVALTDMIFPNIGGSVRILCSDLRTISIIVDTSAPSDCGDIPANLLFPGIAALLSNRSRDTTSRGSAYIVAPYGKTYTQRPTFYWVNIEGAVSYRVQIERNAEKVWSMSDVQTTTFVYPEDKDSLLPGTYTIFVTGFDANQKEITGVAALRSVINIIDETTRTDITQRRDAFESGLPSELSGDMRVYIQAMFYTQEKLYSDAITLLAEHFNWRFGPLNEFYPSSNQSSLIYLQLGFALLEVNNAPEAERAYRTALQLAQVVGNHEAVADAHIGLSYAVSNQQEVVCHLQAAQNFYNHTSNTAQIMELEARYQQELATLSSSPDCSTVVKGPS